MERTTTANAIDFPVLAFSQGTVFVLSDISQLTTATRQGIDNGFFDSLAILDSSGVHWAVNGVQIKERLGLLSRRYRVAPSLTGPLPAPTFEETKRMVSRALRHPKWTSVYGIEELEREVQSARDIKGMIQVLSE